MSLFNTDIQGNASVSRNVNIGTDARVGGSLTVGHDVVVKGWLDAPNIKGPLKGLFASEEELRRAYPRPEAGWFALVGSALPAPIWRADGGKWAATGETGGQLDVHLVTISEDVAQAKEDIADAKEMLEAHADRIVTLIHRASALEDRATVTEGRTAALEGRASALESRASVLESRADAAEATGAEHLERLMALDVQLMTLEEWRGLMSDWQLIRNKKDSEQDTALAAQAAKDEEHDSVLEGHGESIANLKKVHADNLSRIEELKESGEARDEEQDSELDAHAKAISDLKKAHSAALERISVLEGTWVEVESEEELERMAEAGELDDDRIYWVAEEDTEEGGPDA